MLLHRVLGVGGVPDGDEVAGRGGLRSRSRVSPTRSPPARRCHTSRRGERSERRQSRATSGAVRLSGLPRCAGICRAARGLALAGVRRHVPVSCPCSLQPHPRRPRSTSPTRIPRARKWLVGPDLSWGRELAASRLARRTGGWVGWEAITLKRIAADLAFVALAEAGIESASDIELNALVDEALDERGTGRRAVRRPSRGWRRGSGFRRAVRDAVRHAACRRDLARRGSAHGRPAHGDMAAVLEALRAAARGGEPGGSGAACSATALRAVRRGGAVRRWPR